MLEGKTNPTRVTIEAQLRAGKGIFALGKGKKLNTKLQKLQSYIWEDQEVNLRVSDFMSDLTLPLPSYKGTKSKSKFRDLPKKERKL